LIGALAFIVVYLLGRSRPDTCVNGLFFIIAGLVLRGWAAGYIGSDARARFISASRIVRSGPYRFFPHPLYLGNLLIVSGMLISLQPVVWLAFAVLIGFLIEYGLIAQAETTFLRESGLAIEQPGFNWRLALNERHTWLVTGITYLLILVRALVL